MRITKVKLDNYVCFLKTPELELGPGVIIIVGANNSGKTALVRALGAGGAQLLREKFAHRSVHNVSEPGLVLPTEQRGQFSIEYEFSEIELKRILQRRGEPFWLPSTMHLARLGFMNYGGSSHDPEFLSNGFKVVGTFFLGNVPQYELERLSWLRRNYRKGFDFNQFELINGESYRWTNKKTAINVDEYEQQWKFLKDYIHNSIFAFDAERRVSAKAPTTSETRLLPDASNLAQVLNTLDGMQTSRFDIYLEFVKTIFPSVKEILFDYPGNEVELKISYYEPNLERSDLARSLSECGTGLGQVLAILYVVVTFDEPRVIIIDEPQSFLHPGAVRKLLEIFQLPQYSHHQYILTTHSPEVIGSVQEKTVLLVERDDMRSEIKQIDSNCVNDLRLILSSVGARLSDVFGMENIIWVEGETDETCFPMILRANGIPLYGTKILRVAHTGDFTSKDKDHGATAVKLYKRLSAGEALLPPALAFIFDADMEKELQAVRAELGHLVKLLPRQNYESYLIAPEILADILNRDAADDEPKDHTADSVKQWIRKKEGKEYDDLEWLATVDGKNFLNKLFNCLGGVSFKDHTAAYGEEITRRILADNLDHFQEIVDLIKRILNRDKQPEAT